MEQKGNIANQDFAYVNFFCSTRSLVSVSLKVFFSLVCLSDISSSYFFIVFYPISIPVHSMSCSSCTARGTASVCASFWFLFKN